MDKRQFSTIPINVEKLVPLLWWGRVTVSFAWEQLMAVQTRHFHLLIHKLELRKTQRCQSCFPACACMAAILTPISGQTSGILVTEHNLWGHDPFLLCCRALRHPHRKVQCLFCHEGGGSGSQFLPPTH